MLLTDRHTFQFTETFWKYLFFKKKEDKEKTAPLINWSIRSNGQIEFVLKVGTYTSDFNLKKKSRSPLTMLDQYIRWTRLKRLRLLTKKTTDSLNEIKWIKLLLLLKKNNTDKLSTQMGLKVVVWRAVRKRMWRASIESLEWRRYWSPKGKNVILWLQTHTVLTRERYCKE